MNDAIADALIVVALVGLLVCAAGLLVFRNVFERLHFAGAASTIPPVAVAIAVLVGRGAHALALKTALVAIVLVVTGPVLTHATARAAHLREVEEER